MTKAKRAPIYGDPGYNYSHFWRQDAPRCGLATYNPQTQQHLGACRWPKEPGIPWCSAHLGEFFAKMHAAGYQVEQVRAYFAELGKQPAYAAWDAVAVETACARYERFIKPNRREVTPSPEKPSEGPSGAAEEAPKRKPREL